MFEETRIAGLSATNLLHAVLLVVLLAPSGADAIVAPLLLHDSSDYRLDVLVVCGEGMDSSEIYNYVVGVEGSGPLKWGITSAEEIRDFSDIVAVTPAAIHAALEFARGWERPPNYVLLVGNWGDDVAGNPGLPADSDSTVSLGPWAASGTFPSDGALVKWDGVEMMSLGRIPVESRSALAVVLGKINAVRFAQPSNYSTDIVSLVGDKGPSNQIWNAYGMPIVEAEIQLKMKAPQRLKVYSAEQDFNQGAYFRLSDATEQIAAEMVAGTRVLYAYGNTIGYSQLTYMAELSSAYDRNLVAELASQTTPVPLLFGATCLLNFGYSKFFGNPVYWGVGDRLLLTGGGVGENPLAGVATSFGPAHKMELLENTEAAKVFWRAMADDGVVRIGDLAGAVRRELGNSRWARPDLVSSWLLLGDPTLEVGVPFATVLGRTIRIGAEPGQLVSDLHNEDRDSGVVFARFARVTAAEAGGAVPEGAAAYELEVRGSGWGCASEGVRWTWDVPSRAIYGSTVLTYWIRSDVSTEGDGPVQIDVITENGSIDTRFFPSRRLDPSGASQVAGWSQYRVELGEAAGEQVAQIILSCTVGQGCEYVGLVDGIMVSDDVTPTGDTSLIVNGDFEGAVSTGDVPAWWSAGAESGTPTVSRTMENALGNHSLRISKSSAGSASWTEQPVRFTSGHPWLKADLGLLADEDKALRLQWLTRTAGQDEILTESVLSGTGSWTCYSRWFDATTVVPGSQLIVRLRREGAAGGFITVDNVAVTGVADPTLKPTAAGMLEIRPSSNPGEHVVENVAQYQTVSLDVYAVVAMQEIGWGPQGAMTRLKAIEFGLDLPSSAVVVSVDLNSEFTLNSAGGVLEFALVAAEPGIDLAAGEAWIATVRVMLLDSAPTGEVRVTPGSTPSSHVDGLGSLPTWIDGLGQMHPFMPGGMRSRVSVNPSGAGTMGASVAAWAHNRQSVLVVTDEDLLYHSESYGKGLVIRNGPDSSSSHYGLKVRPVYGSHVWEISWGRRSLPEFGQFVDVPWQDDSRPGGSGATLMVRDYAAGALPLEIQELFAVDPTAQSSGEQWIELYNPTAYEIDLRGVEIVVVDEVGAIQRAQLLSDHPLLVPANGHSVLSSNTTSLVSAGVAPLYEFAGLRIPGDSGFQISLVGGQVESTVSFPNGFAGVPPGRSLAWDLVGEISDPGSWAVGTLEYSAGYYGTPGKSNSGTVTGLESPEIPVQGLRLRVVPNPFNPNTTVSFRLESDGRADVRVYDMRGRQVRVLLADREMEAGLQNVTWSGDDSAGRAVATGAYFVVLRFQGTIEAAKVALVK